MALTPGTRLGSYEILDRIGAGGMGEVYKARDIPGADFDRRRHRAGLVAEPPGHGDFLPRARQQIDVSRREGQPRATYFFGGAGRNHDVAPDGRRFVMIKNPSSGAASPPISFVLNWFEELKRLK